ncbi:hypothetical protein [Streptomyces sp. NPDC049879]|uniref:hypothetical protein n=1 Tax=Streptomyces sp. NPDC049879 TaxID=3365598 RepID=UPI0037A14F04
MTDLDLGDAFLDALGPIGDTFLAALDEGAAELGADDAGGPAPQDDFDLDASLKEEAALGAWIARAKARYNQVRTRNKAALVRVEAKTAGRTWTPSVDGVKIGTVTLKGKPREVVVDDPAAFAAWVRTNFPTEVTAALELGDVDDPVAAAAWLAQHDDAPLSATVAWTVRTSFRSKVLQSLNDGTTTTLVWPADKETGEVRELAVAGVTLVDVAPEDRVHQVKFDTKNGGQDAAAAYFRDRGLDALVPGEEDAG